MKIIISRDALATGLQTVLGPTATKQNFPILSGVKIKTHANKIDITTTDLDITISTSQEARILSAGEFVVPMKRFFSIVRELPAQDVNIELDKNNLLINCGKVEFKITTLDKEEFPQIPEPKNQPLIKIESHSLEEAIRLTSFCVGYEDVNYVLNGILFEIEEKEIRLIATDGKRLAFVKQNLPASQADVTSKLSFILPIKTVNELYRLVKERSDEVYLFVEENRVGFDLRGTQLIARPIEGEFPNYKQYLPNEGKDRLTVSRKDFLAALRRASLLAIPEYQGVKIELKKGVVGIYKNTPQLGEVSEVLEAVYNGATLEVGFNPLFLIDVLKNIDDEQATFDFFGADKPAVFRKQGYIYLLLPMKI